MKRRTLRDLEVSAIGLGCMGMSAFYGTTDRDEAVATDLERQEPEPPVFARKSRSFGQAVNE